MKNLILSALLASSVLAAPLSHAAVATADEAKQAFAQREFDDAGIAKAQEAADDYAQLVTETADNALKAEYLVRGSEANYFVADASKAHDVRLSHFDAGYKLADQAVKLLGVASVTSVSDTDLATLKGSASLDLIADGLYFRGINLGQWGQENGVASSLGKWPELRSNMELIGKLGQDKTHEFGAFRTLGKAYAALPSLLGGSMKKAEAFLKQAVEGSLADGQTYSVGAYNNIYYAQILAKTGKVDAAKTLLEGFVAADPATLNPAEVPEVRRAQSDAKEFLKGF